MVGSSFLTAWEEEEQWHLPALPARHRLQRSSASAHLASIHLHATDPGQTPARHRTPGWVQERAVSLQGALPTAPQGPDLLGCWPARHEQTPGEPMERPSHARALDPTCLPHAGTTRADMTPVQHFPIGHGSRSERQMHPRAPPPGPSCSSPHRGRVDRHCRVWLPRAETLTSVHLSLVQGWNRALPMPAGLCYTTPHPGCHAPEAAPATPPASQHRLCSVLPPG